MFKSQYGDYWPEGFRLGADATLLLSEDRRYNKLYESNSLIVKVKVIIKEYEKETQTFLENISADSDLQLAAFDTLRKS